MTKRDTRSSRALNPMGTLPMFDTTTTAEGRVVAAGRFRCGLCNTMGVDEPGELCEFCADHVLTEKCRYRRTPTDEAPATSTTPRRTRKSRVSTAGKASTAGRSTAARKSTGKAAGAEGVG